MDKFDRIMEITNRYLERFNAARAACPPPNFINSPSVQLRQVREVRQVRQVRTTPYNSVQIRTNSYKSVGKRDFSTGKIIEKLHFSVFCAILWDYIWIGIQRKNAVL